MKKTTWHFLALAGLIVFHIVSNFVWLNLNKTPLPWDPANHTSIAIDIKNCIYEKPGLWKIDCIRVSPYYPTFVHSIAAFVMMILGTNVKLAQFLGTVFFAFSLLVVYKWAFNLSNSKTIAIMTAFITSFSAVLFDLSRYFWLDLPVLGITYFTMWMLLRSDNLANKKFTYASFLLLGLGLFSKWYVGVNLIVPFAFAFYRHLKQSGLTSTWEKALMLLGAVSITAGPWYLANVGDFAGYARTYLSGEYGDPRVLFSMENATWYLNSLINYLISPYLFLALLGLGVVFFKSKKPYGKKFIASFIAFNYLAFTLLTNKDYRFVIHLIPAAAYIMAVAIYELGLVKKVVGYAISGVIAAYLIFFYFELSYRLPINTEIRIPKQFLIVGWINLINITDYPAQSYKNIPWPNDSVVEQLLALSENRPTSVIVTVEYPQINNSNLSLGLKELGAKNITVNRGFPFDVLGKLNSDEDIKNYLYKHDFLVVPQIQASPDYHQFRDSLDQIQRFALAESGITKEASSSSMLARELTYKVPVEELKKYLAGSDLGYITSSQDEYCKERVCDEVYILRIKKPVKF